MMMMMKMMYLMVCYRGHVSQDQGGGGDTDEPAVDWGKDAEESDRAVAEVKLAGKKAGVSDYHGFRLKRQDMGDSADSRSAYVLCLWEYFSGSLMRPEKDEAEARKCEVEAEAKTFLRDRGQNT